MPAIDKIVIAIREHGPMGAEALSKHVESDNIHALLGYYTGKGTLTKSGTGREAVYDVAKDVPTPSTQPEQRRKRTPASPRKARKAKAARRTAPKKAKRKYTKRRPRAASAPAVARRANANGEVFTPAIVAGHRLMLVENGVPRVYSREQTAAIAELMTEHFPC